MIFCSISDQTHCLGNKNILINSNNTNIAPKSTIICNNEMRYLEIYRKRVSKSIKKLGACLLLLLFISMVGFGSFIVWSYKNSQSIRRLETLHDQSSDNLKKLESDIRFIQVPTPNSKSIFVCVRISAKKFPFTHFYFE